MPGEWSNDPRAGGKPTLTEAKRLLRRWNCGTFNTRALSIRYHYAQHGTAGLWFYLKEADAFD